MSYFNDDENETVRQTLERVMKEKGMWKEPKVMHTEIGDFHYFDDDNTNTAGGTATGNNVTTDNNFSQPANEINFNQPADNTGLTGQPSSYFQNNNSIGGVNNRPSIGVNNYTSNTNTTIGQPNNEIKSNTSNDIPRYWENSVDGKKVYDYMMQQEGNFTPPIQRPELYQYSAFSAVPNMIQNYFKLKPLNVTDKYKHAYMNCSAAQYGQGGVDMATLASNLREWYDKKSGANTLDSSEGDQYANRIGRFLGSKYPEEDCDELIQRYINRRY